MDIEQVVDFLNKGGWMVEGRWNGREWIKPESDRASTIVGAMLMPAAFQIRLAERTVLTYGFKKYPNIDIPISIESSGEIDNPERIVVKSPALDDAGQPTGEMTARLVLVNWNARLQNGRRMSDEQVRLRRRLKESEPSATTVIAGFKGLKFETLRFGGLGGIEVVFEGGARLELSPIDDDGGAAFNIKEYYLTPHLDE